MGNVLLRFDRDYFLDAVGVQGADRKLLLNNVYLSLEWAKMDRGSMTEAEAAESMCRRLPQRLHETAHLLVDRWDRPILPIAGMEQLVSDLKRRDTAYICCPTPATASMNTGRGYPAVSILTGRLFPPTSSRSSPVQKSTIFCTKHSILFLRNVCLSTIPLRTSKVPSAPVCRASSSTATRTSFAGKCRLSAFRFRKYERTAPGKFPEPFPFQHAM